MVGMILPITVFVEGLIFGSEIHKSRALKFILSFFICLMSCSFYGNVYTTVLCLSLEYYTRILYHIIILYYTFYIR